MVPQSRKRKVSGLKEHLQRNLHLFHLEEKSEVSNLKTCLTPLNQPLGVELCSLSKIKMRAKNCNHHHRKQNAD